MISDTRGFLFALKFLQFLSQHLQGSWDPLGSAPAPCGCPLHPLFFFPSSLTVPCFVFTYKQFFFPIISLPNSFPQNYACFSIAKDNSAADTNKDAKAPKCPTPLGADGIGSTPTVGRAQRSLRTESWGGSWRNSSGSWPQTGP